MECGTEGLVYEGLCASCLPRKRTFVRLPEVLELVECVHCGAVRLPGGWRHASRQEALEALVDGAAETPREVRSRHLTVTAEPRDPHALGLAYRARVELPSLAVTQEGEAEVRLKRATCPTCSRQRGAYFEAILQVRAQGRSLQEAEEAVVREAVARRVQGTEGLFVAREERVHGGLDLYLSSNPAARALARLLGERLGGQVAASPRLHTRKGGKDVYRVTYRVRLPAFARGDVIRLQGRPHRVLRLGNPVVARDLTTGEERRFDPRTVAGAEPLDAQVREGIVVLQEGEELEVLDTETQEVLRVRRPPALRLEGDRLTLVRTGDRTYLGPPEG